MKAGNAGLAAALALAIGAPAATAGDTLAIASVHRSAKDDRRLYVVLALPLPEPAAVASPAAWQVRALRPGQPPAVLDVSQAEPAAAYATRHSVTLRLGTAIPADALRVEATLLLANQPTGTTAEAPEPPSAFEPVDDPDDATVYFNGIVAPSAGAKTLYTIDTRADVTLRRFGATGGTRLAVTGKLKTDERTHVDPDSARIGASLERVRGYAPVLRWDVITFEFDREAKLVNLLSAGSVRQTWGRIFTTARDGTTVVRCAFNLEAGLGAEVGANLRNEVSVESDGDDGSGTIARLVPRVGAWLVVPSRFLDRIVLSAEYVVRFPATSELFYETRDLPADADPVPSLTKKPRHYVTASARFMVSKWFGIETKYEFGSLPPVFRIVDHSATIGLTFMGRQNER